MYVSSSSFMYLRISCYCDACLNWSDLRVGVSTLLNTILIFRLVLTLNKHGLKILVLVNTLSGPQFSISQHFDVLSNVTADLGFCVTHSLWRSVSNGCMFLYSSRTILSDKQSEHSFNLQLYKSGICNLKLCITLGSM